MSGTANVVELWDVKKSYRAGEIEYSVLKRINLEIKQGEFIVLMGPYGSEKSTLNIVGCLDRPTSGRYLLFGKDVIRLADDELSRARRLEFGFIFQTFNLISRMSVLKNVEVPMILSEVSPGERKTRALELLRALGLEKRGLFSPFKISGGERHRVAIACALANNPRIIIADEPTGNLDLKSSREVMAIIKRLNDEGRTIIMVTHNPEITSNCNRIIKLRDGRITEGAS